MEGHVLEFVQSELFKLGLAGVMIIGLSWFLRTVWNDNVKLRKEIADQQTEHKKELRLLNEVILKAVTDSIETITLNVKTLENHGRLLESTNSLNDQRNTIMSQIGGTLAVLVERVEQIKEYTQLALRESSR